MTDDMKKLAEAEKVAWERYAAFAASLKLATQENIEKAKEEFALYLEASQLYRRATKPDAILALIRERDEAREQCDGYRLAQSLDKDSAYVIRELLNRHNVPPAAFIDDHVGNAVAQRDAAEAALSAAREEVAKLTDALRYAGEAIDTGRSEPLFIARDLIRNTLTKEPTDV